MEIDSRASRVAPDTVVKGDTVDLDLPFRACLIEGIVEPCIIVIFGASGDLAARKLMPALFDLYINEVLPSRFVIVGCSRTRWHRDVFREQVKKAVQAAGYWEASHWDGFAEALYYQAVLYDDPSSFAVLGETLGNLDEEHGTEGNRVFYLAIPPTLYKTTSEMLAGAGLAREGEGDGEKKWARIVIEKPFGRDLGTAVDLNNALHRGFREHQIYRIDHYLAKETVQNLLMFRFANSIFEPIWNRSYVDYVGIIAAETLGVEHRAGYYEQAGVLRDMFQNHMLQLLTLTAMEPPSAFEAERVRDEKIKVFRSLKPLVQSRPEENLILGQYGPGVVNGMQVPGYREEAGVDPESLTPTLAAMRVFIDNWRWRGVPFYVVSGKRLAEKLTQIVIQFREVPHSMFQSILGERIMANRLILGVYPDERITLTFQTKYPGARVCLRSVTMDFNYYQQYSGPKLDAYEKLLLDCIQGDHMLFWRQDAVELCWAFLTPILEECEDCPDQRDRLHSYASGSWGPEQVGSWIEPILRGYT